MPSRNTACLLGLAAGQLIAGSLSDSLGRRRPLVDALVAYSLASLLCAFAPTVPVLVVLRLIQGIAGAVGLVIAQAVVRDVYEGSDWNRCRLGAGVRGDARRDDAGDPLHAQGRVRLLRSAFRMGSS